MSKKFPIPLKYIPVNKYIKYILLLLLVIQLQNSMKESMFINVHVVCLSTGQVLVEISRTHKKLNDSLEESVS